VPRHPSRLTLHPSPHSRLNASRHTLFHNLTIGITAYKGFGKSGVEIPPLKPFNLIVCRNNSGKSAILDVLGFLSSNKEDIPIGTWGQPPTITITQPLALNTIQRVFSDSTSGGGVLGNHGVYGRRYVGASICFEARSKRFVSLTPGLDLETPYAQHFSAALAKESHQLRDLWRFRSQLDERRVVELTLV
jgi:hypothetical protein